MSAITNRPYSIAIGGRFFDAGIAATWLAAVMAISVIILSPQINAQQTRDANSSSCVAFDQSHAAFTVLLKDAVTGGKVNYQRLRNNPAPLEQYLHDLEAVCKSTFAGFTGQQKLAFYINAYNAYTLHLVMQHYPVKSIRDIGDQDGDAWKQKAVRLKNLFGHNVSLDYLENKVIRPRFKEPRAHFALNCASRGCPPLRATAFTAKGLHSQLNVVTRNFLADTRKNRYDPGKNTLQLSPIFDWFAKDFGGPDQLAAFYARYAPADVAALVQKQLTSGTPPGVTFSSYDWGLNR